MAFRQPSLYAPQRTAYASAQVAQEPNQPIPLHTQQHLAESKEWVLFSPSAASTTDRAYTVSTTHTRTAGRSRRSALASIHSTAQSYGYSEDAVADEEVDFDGDGEDAELDSLDSHLHEFNKAEPAAYLSGTVLPTHDGLGSFRLDRTAMGDDVQEQLYAFERYNPRRVKRRRESQELAAFMDDLVDGEGAQEAETMRRIERWRTEQSKFLVDEIQRETRRRKHSMSGEQRTIRAAQEQEDVATLSNVDTANTEADADDSFWNRITKQLIRDLLGIDDNLLAVIFGEELPEDLSPKSISGEALSSTIWHGPSSWETRLIERIAHEVGILVHQITESAHPGAFSTYLHTQNISIPYAGLPVIPELAPRAVETDQFIEASLSSDHLEPEFIPTLQTHAEAQPMSIPLPSNSLEEVDEDATPPGNVPLTREEWEKDLDLKMVFRYLRGRMSAKFSSSPSSASPTQLRTTGTSHLATASTTDSAARAARVRQHHPLVSERQDTVLRQRTFNVSVPGGALSLSRRGSSSCASERIAGTGGVMMGKQSVSGSSRHYWDWGGSVGSANGSAVLGGVGVMGSWGEV